MWCKVHCLECFFLKKKRNNISYFVSYIIWYDKSYFVSYFISHILYHILHIAMKHVGEQEKILDCRMPGWISIIGFCVCVKFANPPSLEIESPPSE